MPVAAPSQIVAKLNEPEVMARLPVKVEWNGQLWLRDTDRRWHQVQDADAAGNMLVPLDAADPVEGAAIVELNRLADKKPTQTPPSVEQSVDGADRRQLDTASEGRQNIIDGGIPAEQSTPFDRSDSFDQFRTIHAALEERAKNISAGQNGQQLISQNAGTEAVSAVPTVRFTGDGRISLAVDSGKWWESLLVQNADNHALALSQAEQQSAEELWHVAQLVAMRNDWLAMPAATRGSFVNHVTQASSALMRSVQSSAAALPASELATVQEAMHGAWSLYFNDALFDLFGG